MSFRESYEPTRPPGAPLNDDEMARLSAVIHGLMHFTRVWAPSEDPGIDKDFLSVAGLWLTRLNPDEFPDSPEAR